MFESITFKNTIGPGPLIDIGALAEGLLFYGRVAIVGSNGTLKDLLNQIPPFILLSLMRDKRLEFYYLEDQIAVSTSTLPNAKSLHNLILFSSPEHTIEKDGPKIFKNAAKGNYQANIGAIHFSRLLRPLNHSTFDQNSILDALCGNPIIEKSVMTLIGEIAPSYGFSSNAHFILDREKQGFTVDTNIDFNALNILYHQVVPPSHSSLSEAYLLALIQGAYEATYLAAVLDSEIAVHPLERTIQASTITDVINRHSSSQAQIESFCDLTLPSCHAIREAVNSRSVSFSSIVKLLDSADKFRHWLHQQPPDEGLVRAYYQETVKDSWVEKLPAKSTRWLMFTGLGIGLDALGAGGIGTLAGVAASAADSFLLDKLIKGWKPHQFVEKELKSLFTDMQKYSKKANKQ